MNLKEIVKLQEELDEKIAKELDINLDDDEFVRKRLLAYYVELGELANETAFFKYWKQSHQPDTHREIEELIDVLHFLVSIGITRKYTKMMQEIEPFPFYEEATFEDMFEMLFANRLDTSAQWHHAMSLVLGLGHKLGYNDDLLLKAYETKNQINHERQEKGY